VLDLVVSKTAAALGDWCSIYLLDESGRSMRLSASYHADRELMGRVKELLGNRPIGLEELPGGRAILEGKPLLTAHVDRNQRTQYGRVLPGLARSKREVATSFLTVPLRAGGQILGAMAITCTGGRRTLTGDDLSLASRLADRAALALDNAALYQRAERERVRLKAIIDSLPEGVIVAEGAAGLLTMANRVAEAMWGRPIRPGTAVAELAGVLADADGHDNQISQSKGLFDAMATGQAVFSREIAVHRPDGTVLELLASSAPYVTDSHETCGLVAVFQDISQIKHIERLRDEFLSITSHELRTPLTSLKGFAQILLRKAERKRGLKDDLEALQVINRQINRMTALVKDLLDVTRIQAGQMILSRESVDVVCLARRVATQAQAMTSRHRLQVRAREDSLFGDWDEHRLEQVLMNLLDNAVKYSEQGLVELNIYRDGDEAVVSVRDSGVGLSKENQLRVFDRFYRGGDISTRHVGGLGLGLYICNQLVGCHGGRMWVESEEGNGATFCFALPLTTDHGQQQGGEEDDRYAEGVDCRR